jgi:hypothetical protein
MAIHAMYGHTAVGCSLCTCSELHVRSIDVPMSYPQPSPFTARALSALRATCTTLDPRRVHVCISWLCLR